MPLRLSCKGDPQLYKSFYHNLDNFGGLNLLIETAFVFMRENIVKLIPAWFRKITFINGLPDIGKSRALYRIIYKDNHKDLVLNLRHHKDIDHIRYSVNYIKARGLRPLPAYRIPKYSQYARYHFLELFALKHPHIKHVLIDEVERYRLRRLIHLCQEIHHLYPHVPIVLVGVIKNDRNMMLETSEFLLYNCKIINMNPKCKFCDRKATFMLDVWHHKIITHDKLEGVKNKIERKYIKHNMKRYHVCFYHYVHPRL